LPRLYERQKDFRGFGWRCSPAGKGAPRTCIICKRIRCYCSRAGHTPIRMAAAWPSVESGNRWRRKDGKGRSKPDCLVLSEELAVSLLDVHRVKRDHVVFVRPIIIIIFFFLPSLLRNLASKIQPTQYAYLEDVGVCLRYTAVVRKCVVVSLRRHVATWLCRLFLWNSGQQENRPGSLHLLRVQARLLLRRSRSSAP